MRINNKRGFALKDWIVALLLFTGIFAIGGLMIFDQASTYNSVSVSNYTVSQNYNHLNLVQDTANRIVASYPTNTGNQGIVSTALSYAVFFVTATLSIFGLIIGTFFMIPMILIQFLNDSGMPSVISAILVTVVTASITVFIIMKMISSTSYREF